MITPETLAILRCPFDSRRETRLSLEEDVRLLCERCDVRFKIRDGLPNMVQEEAILPESCESTKQLPCQEKS
jgi:uncharacterized protein